MCIEKKFVLKEIPNAKIKTIVQNRFKGAKSVFYLVYDAEKNEPIAEGTCIKRAWQNAKQVLLRNRFWDNF
jgi:hypothetical protein